MTKQTVGRRSLWGLVLAMLSAAGCAGAASASDAVLAMGDGYSCVRLATGAVSCWGSNALGQLGDGSNTARVDPTPVVGLTGVAQIAAGSTHTCARLRNGTVQCWGANSAGQLGDGTTRSSTTPVAVRDLTGVTQVAVGQGGISCARMSDGTVRCWGANNYGQRGNGTTVEDTAVSTVVGLRDVTQVAMGEFNSCALLADGTVRCWGIEECARYYGASPTGIAPQPVADLAGATQIAMYRSRACARVSDGTVRCWDVTLQSGQLNSCGAYFGESPMRAQAMPGITDVTQVALGADFTCVLREDARVRCWGANFAGQLGRSDSAAPSVVGSSEAIEVPGLANVREVEAGAQHACAVNNAGEVRCWGQESNG